MATTIRVVKPEHRAIIDQYLDASKGGVVLILSDQAAEALEDAGFKDGDDTDYDFLGESDLLVDVVKSDDDPFFGEVENNMVSKI